MNAIESGLVQFYEPCAGGCGEPILGGAMCTACARLAERYDEAECRAMLRATLARREARLAAVGAPARRGVFTFLGWSDLGVRARAARLQCAPERAGTADRLRSVDTAGNGAGVETGHLPAGQSDQRAARLEAESEAAPECGDPARRSALLAKLPRVRAGVKQMHGLSRWELWQSDVPLATVVAIVICDAARWAWCWVMDALGCFVSRRLRGRLGLSAMVVGIALGAGASWLAWGLR